MNEVINRILDLSKSYEEADFLRDIFGPFRKDAISGNIPVVLFGAGSAGKELYPLFKNHGVNPVCFCDNNPERHGDVCCGIQVISPAELSKLHRDSLIIVTTARHRNDITMQLVARGFISDRILCINEEALTRYYSHICLSYWTYDDFINHRDHLSAAYDLLYDDNSKRFFTSYLSLLTKGSDYRSFCSFIHRFSDTALYNYNVCESYLYFNTDIIDIGKGEVLVDCGAYNGDTAIEFIKACQARNVAYKHIYCFEPEPSMFSELSKSTVAYSNISLNKCGLWTHSTTLSFINTEFEKPGSTRVIRDSGDIHFSDEKIANSEVRVVSIDEQFPNDDVTFIKMDIEGAEIEAIQGAETVIRRCKPKLAISIYHKRNDIFEIPLLIHQITPGYKFYLRQFSNALSETVLFAIP
jgi:FkbM family methyltransferase